MEKLVSIILPTYNGASHIANAIDSVIAQTYRHWELLIIDDGSVDATMDVVSKFTTQDSRIRYIKNEKNLGIQKTLNRGLSEAKGEYIARIDDDDEWIDKEKLAQQFAFLEINKDFVLVGTNAIIVDPHGNVLGKYLLPEIDQKIRERILSKNCFLHPSVMMRKSIVKKVGGYSENEDAQYIEDYALWLNMGLFGKFANLPEIMVQLMIHPQSLTAKNRIKQVDRMCKITYQYKEKYPRFVIGYLILFLRKIGFTIISYVPIPKSFLYFIQNLYKSF